MTIIEKDGNYFLKGILTPAGISVFHSNRKLIEKINETQNGRYDETKFGLYSIYCTYRDFIADSGLYHLNDAFFNMTLNDPFFGNTLLQDYSIDFPTEGVREKLESLFDSLNIPKAFLENPDPENLYNLYVKKCLESISPEKLTAFVLLNGHLVAPMSLLLLFLNDLYSIENFKCNSYQFDSKENAHYFEIVEVVKSWLKVFN
ncbi:hypothetical protein ND860_17960 [Leptospira levettii]|uniref:hypothetical protein n=1 Tax=Leptospira levettii TaxID=2023178 RepID=UPI00223D080F|nr:hypothetical protein [Leptospira levettii]MCW7498427.1 hypothetical protein [Leptospira levettii]